MTPRARARRRASNQEAIEANSKMNRKAPVEIRPNPDGSIDEIYARGCDLSIEQMSNDGWYMGIEASDGSTWQFWFGSRNRRTPVDFRHNEIIPPKRRTHRAKG